MRTYRPIVVTESDERRFYAKVALPDANGCALWTASADPIGYGRFGLGRRGQYARAHRVAYVIANGEIPPEMQLDHTCHNPRCVAADHLRLATSAQNNQNRSGPFSNSRSGVRGVAWYPRYEKWNAQATVCSKRTNLGYFATIDEAAAAISEFRREHMPYSVVDQAVSA